jgi:serine/threonine protein kinase/flagellar biosynthesis GTPase FlhF
MESGTDYLLGQLLSLIFYTMTLIIYNRARREYAGGKIANAINLIMMFLAILLITDSADYFLQAFLSVGDDIELIVKILLKLLALSVLFFGGLRFFSKRQVTMPTEHDFSSTDSIGLASPPLAGNALTDPEIASDPGSISQKIQPTLGRYEIIEQIGKGAMGIVYKGRDPKLQRLTAIKTIRFIDDYDEDKVEKVKAYFYHEAEVVARLSHKNIVKIYDVGEDLDLSYLAMEYLEGESLETYCQEDRLLPVSRIIDIIGQVCDALEYAHNHGIVHRDIKPGNIMVLKNGEVKVTDFGIARAAGSTKTRTGIIKGTPYYMSPEQAHGLALDGRADIFSLGVVFYHVLSGKLPFTGENLAAIMYQTANTDPTPPSAYNTDAGQPVIDILNRALAKDPRERFQTAAQMAEELKKLNIEPDTEGAAGSGIAAADDEAPSMGEPASMGDIEKEKLDFSDLDQALTLETRGRSKGRPDGTVVIEQGPDGNLAATQDDATRKIDLSGLAVSQSGPPETPSYQVVKTILPPAAAGDDTAAALIASRQAGSRAKALMANRLIIYLLAGILLLGSLGAGYFLLWKRPAVDDAEKMQVKQKELVRKIMQEKMLEKQRLASEEVQKQKALEAQQAKEGEQRDEQQRVVKQKLEEARKKQEAERIARLEAEKKKEQERLEAIRIEKEKEQARLAAEEAEKKAEAERIAEAERKKIAAQKQHDLETVEKHMQAADFERQEKRFPEAKKGYETALAFIQNSRFRNDNDLAGFRKKIESNLAADDIVYGSKGYILHKGKWLSPEELELARYSEGFVKYKGDFRDHRALKNTIKKLCDPIIQKHLTQKYSGKTVHSKNIYFQKMILTRNNAAYSQYTVFYKWSVSTFKGMDEDICTIDIKYNVSTDKWSLLKGCE